MEEGQNRIMSWPKQQLSLSATFRKLLYKLCLCYFMLLFIIIAVVLNLEYESFNCWVIWYSVHLNFISLLFRMIFLLVFFFLLTIFIYYSNRYSCLYMDALLKLFFINGKHFLHYLITFSWKFRAIFYSLSLWLFL